MPARTRKIRHDDETRAKIKTSQIINRLTGHVLGEVEMSPSQVAAGLGLLRKTIPDLSQTEMRAEHVHRYVARMPAKTPTMAEWEQQHLPTTNETTLQ